MRHADLDVVVNRQLLSVTESCRNYENVVQSWAISIGRGDHGLRLLGQPETYSCRFCTSSDYFECKLYCTSLFSD